MAFQRKIFTQKTKKMTAETVMIVFRELSTEEKKRFISLLANENFPLKNVRKKRKPKVWDETEIIEKLEVLLKKEGAFLIAIIGIIVK